MARRGRPPSQRAASAQVVHIKLRLYPGDDDDLIVFFATVVPGLRAAMVKQALRSGMSMTYRADGRDELFDVLDSLVS